MMEDLRCQEVFKESSLSPEMSRNVGYSPAMVCRAYKDPVLLEDNRVFQNMLHIEEFYIAATNYFQNTQNEIKPHMRKIVTDWMLEVGSFCFVSSHWVLFFLSRKMVSKEALGLSISM